MGSASAKSINGYEKLTDEEVEALELVQIVKDVLATVADV